MKLVIVGGIGSGKTTLASRISRETGVAMYSLDEIYFLPGELQKRIKTPEGERDQLLKSFLVRDQWVIEGTYYGAWTHPCFVAADVTLFLECSRYRRAFRIILRYFKRVVGAQDGRAGTLRHLVWLLKFNHIMDSFFANSIREIEAISNRFERIEDPNAYRHILDTAGIPPEVRSSAMRVLEVEEARKMR